MEGATTNKKLQEVKLFVKAGADGVRYGACPICQRLFMLLALRAKEGQLSFKVATVNLSKPPDDFRKLGLKKLPALAHTDTDFASDYVDEIFDFLDDTFGPLETSNQNNNNNVDSADDGTRAEVLTNSAFSKFCFFIKAVSKDPAHMIQELAKLDNHLTKTKDSCFLLGDRLSLMDCELLPQLHHLRVASQQLKSFSIPTEMAGLWRYLYNAYSEPIFVQSCPSDQEIVLHWADKPETPNLSFEKHAQLTKEVAVFSFDIPATAKPIHIES